MITDGIDFEVVRRAFHKEEDIVINGMRCK